MGKLKNEIERKQRNSSYLGKKTLDEVWNEVEVLAEKKSPNYKKRGYKNILAYIAMTATLLAALYVFYPNLVYKIYKTDIAETDVITFPNGTVVYLQPLSSIMIPRFGNDNDKNVMARGEVLFDFKKGSEKFNVILTKGNISVTGTRIKIIDRLDSYEVSCLSGKLKYTDINNNSVEVSKGEAINFGDGKLGTKSVNITNEEGRIRGVFYYSNTDLEVVFEELERQLGYMVKYDSTIAKRKYTGIFSNNSLDSALEMICLPLELKYRINKNHKLIIIENY